MAQFYRVPKALYTGEYFCDISFEAKAIYGMMIDRVSLSIKMGGWMKMVKTTYTIAWQILWLIPAVARIIILILIILILSYQSIQKMRLMRWMSTRLTPKK